MTFHRSRNKVTINRRRYPTGMVLCCLVVLAMALRGIVTSQRNISNGRGSPSGTFENMPGQTPEHRSRPGPLCIYAQNRGWGNSVFAVLTFLTEATKVQETILRNNDDGTKERSGFVDLRTATPCSPNDDPTNQHCVNYSFPCIFVEDRTKDDDNTVISTLGNVYANLFTNMHACPNDPSVYSVKRCPKRTGQRKDVHELKIARDAITTNRPKMPEIFELNATHIRYILQESGSLVTLEDLLHRDICAMHFRFGDYWLRDGTPARHMKDKRLCRDFDKDGNETDLCFEQQAEVLWSEACPDPSVPVYLATDYEEFARYVCEHHQSDEAAEDHLGTTAADGGSATIRATHDTKKRRFISRCPVVEDSRKTSNSNTPDNKHIHDVDLASESGKQILHHMLADWLVLALSRTSPLRKHILEDKMAHNLGLRFWSFKKPYAITSYGSTFVETADLHWKVV